MRGRRTIKKFSAEKQMIEKETNGKLELGNTISKIKGLTEQMNSRMDILEERIHHLGNKPVKMIRLR